MRASADRSQKVVSPVCTSKRNALLGFAGACAGLLLPFQASAAQTTLKVDFPLARTSNTNNKAYVPGGMNQNLDKSNGRGIVYVGRGGGGKGGTGG